MVRSRPPSSRRRCALPRKRCTGTCVSFAVRATWSAKARRRERGTEPSRKVARRGLAGSPAISRKLDRYWAAIPPCDSSRSSDRKPGETRGRTATLTCSYGSNRTNLSGSRNFGIIGIATGGISRGRIARLSSSDDSARRFPSTRCYSISRKSTSRSSIATATSNDYELRSGTGGRRTVR